MRSDSRAARIASAENLRALLTVYAAPPPCLNDIAKLCSPQFNRAALAIASIASGWRDRTFSVSAPQSSQAR